MKLRWVADVALGRMPHVLAPERTSVRMTTAQKTFAHAINEADIRAE
jgi:hypothetical protein